MRGLANAELTPELAMALGRAASRVLGGDATHARVAVGSDTRRSGPLLFGALSAGIAAEGLDVIDLGVVPTPAVALRAHRDNIVGAMISASHNPFEDNGIKFFAAGGLKLPDAVEASIEQELDRVLAGHASPHRVVGADVGRVAADSAFVETYVAHVVDALEGRTLRGLRVVLDVANGATSLAAPLVFRALGAEVVVLNDSPEGTNINEHCGSTHPESLQQAVIAHQAHLGFAFDGDADRMLAVDATGTLVDGDQILAMLALDRHKSGRLAGNTVVVTVMTNLGFRLAMTEHGVTVVDTAVGDRYVLEAMLAGGFVLGGEQSGHVINADIATTGDGTLSAALVADLVTRSGRSLADHAAVMQRLPQVLRNVKGVDRARLADAEELWAEVRAVETELSGRGRVLLRPSGTEALVRVMVEAPTHDAAAIAAARLCSTVERVLGPAV